MRVPIICGVMAIFALLALGATSCDETTCGEGTVLSEGECVPLQPANCDGPGVRFENGICVPDYSEVCGSGTELSDDGLSCIPTEAPADPAVDAGRDQPDTEVVDLAADPTADPDATGDADADVATDTEDEEIVEWEPECGDDLVAGEQVCAWGQALNFITMQPLPGDTAQPRLQVQIKDLYTAMSNLTASLAETFIGTDGIFIAPSFDLVETPPRTVILIVGEDEVTAPEGPGSVWQRAISGIFTSDTTSEVYDELTVFGLPRASVTAWNTALSTTLETAGFVLIRIVEVMGEGQYVPLEGATLNYGGAGTVTIRYFSDLALTTLKPGTATTTGPSGVALLIPGAGASATDTCSATLADYSAVSAVACGANPYRASINYVFMLATD